MRIGKNKNNKSVKSMTLVLALALVLVFGCAVGGTLAWLMDTTAPVTNTFTVGNIDIDLKEHDLVGDNLNMNKEVTAVNTYKIIPGTSQPKDPFVRVEAGSEACWVFIKVEAVNNEGAYITYSVDSAIWTPRVDGNNDGIADDGVYYKDMPAVTDDAYLNILSNKSVSYSDKLTKTDIDRLYNIKKDAAGNVVSMTMLEETKLPKLAFTAYAIQKTAANGTNFSVEDAWNKLDSSTP